MKRHKSAWWVALLASAVGVIVLWKRLDRETPSGTGADHGQARAARPAPPKVSTLPWSGPDGEEVRTADRDPHGDVTLAGVVIDGATPVAGAQVSLNSIPGRTVTSDENGRFRFDGLLRRPYTLVARTGDRLGGPVTVPGGKATEVVLHLGQGSSLRVRVVASGSETPLPGAMVEVRGPMVASAATAADGWAAIGGLPAGEYVVASWADRRAKRFADVTLAAAGVQELQLALSEGVEVAGRVVDETQRPVARAFVTFERVADSLVSTAALPDPTRDGAITDQEGRFILPHMPVGTFRLLARHPELAPGSSGPVPVDGRTRLDGVQIVMPAGGELTGRVVSSKGEPVAGATVRIAPRQLRRTGQLIREVATDAAGQFRMQGLRTGGLHVLATAEAGTSEVLEVTLSPESRSQNLIITLDADQGIAGVVVDPAGEPVAEAQVTATPDLTRGDRKVTDLGGFPATVTDGAGAFTLHGLRGTYRLRARPPQGSRRRSARWSESDTIAQAGDKGVRLVLEPPGAISGSVKFRDGSAPRAFSVSYAGQPPQHFLRSDGQFRLDDVEPGTESLVVMGPAFTHVVQSNVKVRGGQTTNVGAIEVTPGRRIAGRVITREGSPVAGARVYIGNQLVANGAEITTMSWNGATANAPQSVVADEKGNFEIGSYGFREAALVADHPEAGRSSVVKVPDARESSTIDLVVAPVGALEGRVARQGKPAPGVNVNVSPVALGNNSHFIVQSGLDGSYRFERLAAGEYQVSALQGGTPIGGITFNGRKTIKIAGGETVRLDLELEEKHPLVQIITQLPGGRSPRVTEIHVLEGAPAFANSGELRAFASNITSGFSAFKVEITGRPAKLRVRPGQHALCVIPYPDSVSTGGADAVRQYVDTHAGAMPVFCQRIQVGSQPDQSFTIDVTEPPVLTAQSPPQAAPGAPGNPSTAPPQPNP